MKALFFFEIVFFSCLNVLSQDSVERVLIPPSFQPTNPNAAFKTPILKVQPLNSKPTRLAAIDSVSLAIVTPVLPSLREEKIIVKDFEDFKDTAKLIYDTSDNQLLSPRQSELPYTFINNYTFDAHLGDFAIPLDNTIALSDSGHIVSITNGTVEIYEEEKLKYRRYLTPFLKGSLGVPCDPKIIFDPTSKRFVLFSQSCDGLYDKSNILLGFSATNNPIDGWLFYRISISGHPFRANDWFDFPKVGLSTDGLFLMGNIYHYENGKQSFVQSIVYQIDKEAGYKGGELSFRIWYNFNGTPAVLAPVSFGHNGVYGPGVFLIGTSFQRNANHIKLYDISGSIYNDSVKTKYYEVPTTPYNFFARARQKNISGVRQKDIPIDNGDLRIQDAFYSDGKIVFVFTSGDSRNFSRINLNVLNLSTRTNRSILIGDNANSSYAFPSVMPISEHGEPLRIVVQYNTVSNKTYPSIKYKVCDENLNCSGEVIAREGENAILGVNRWGDYSTIAKDYSTTNSLWLSSSYGSSEAVRQASITNVVPREMAGNITGVVNQLANESFHFKIHRKTLVSAFLIDEHNVRRKVFEGVVWPGNRRLSLITENLEKGKNYKVEIVSKKTNSIIKTFDFSLNN